MNARARIALLLVSAAALAAPGVALADEDAPDASMTVTPEGLVEATPYGFGPGDYVVDPAGSAAIGDEDVVDPLEPELQAEAIAIED